MASSGRRTLSARQPQVPGARLRAAAGGAPLFDGQSNLVAHVDGRGLFRRNRQPRSSVQARQPGDRCSRGGNLRQGDPAISIEPRRRKYRQCVPGDDVDPCISDDPCEHMRLLERGALTSLTCSSRRYTAQYTSFIRASTAASSTLPWAVAPNALAARARRLPTGTTRLPLP